MATEQERNRGLGAYSTPGVDTPADGVKPFVPITSAPNVEFRTTKIDPPSFVYIGREDKLFAMIWTPIVPNNVSVILRILRPDGQVVINSYTFLNTVARNNNTFVQELTEGFLLSIMVFTPTGALNTKLYGVVGLIRGQLGGAIRNETLCKGFFTFDGPLAWPYTTNKDMTDGAGNLVDVTGSTPAAGAEINESILSNVRRILRTISFTLTTAVAVANREVTLVLDDGSNILAQVPSTFTQAASLVHRYTFALGLQTQAGAQALIHTAPLPDMRIEASWRVRTLTANIQAGDQYSAPQYEMEEWPDF